VKGTVNLDLPFMILGAGVKEPASSYSPTVHAGVCQDILERLSGTSEKGSVPEYVLCCNFYALAAEPDSAAYEHAWFRSQQDALPIVDMLAPEIMQEEPAPMEEKQIEDDQSKSPSPTDPLPIDHYLLLPLYEWGVADYHLEVIRPYVQKFHPTIGFSIQEAALAKKVTVLGGEQTFSEDTLSTLRSQGCVVERVSGDGTSIATQLVER
jgi:hypothetical protein